MSSSTRTVFSSLPRPEVSIEIITALITMLKTLELETKNLLGETQLRNLAAGNLNKKSFEEFIWLGNQPVEKLPPRFLSAITTFRAFKLSLFIEKQSQLDNTLIELPTSLGYTRIERFADICFSKLPNRTPEQSCIFTSQIFLWQLIVNSGSEAAKEPPIPGLIKQLAKHLLCDIQVLGQSEIKYSTTHQKYNKSAAVLMPNISYHEQLEKMRDQDNSSHSYGSRISPYKGELFQQNKNRGNATKSKKAANLYKPGLSVIEEESEPQRSCKA